MNNDLRTLFDNQRINDFLDRDFFHSLILSYLIDQRLSDLVFIDLSYNKSYAFFISKNTNVKFTIIIQENNSNDILLLATIDSNNFVRERVLYKSDNISFYSFYDSDNNYFCIDSYLPNTNRKYNVYITIHYSNEKIEELREKIKIIENKDEELKKINENNKLIDLLDNLLFLYPLYINVTPNINNNAFYILHDKINFLCYASCKVMYNNTEFNNLEIKVDYFKMYYNNKSVVARYNLHPDNPTVMNLYVQRMTETKYPEDNYSNTNANFEKTFKSYGIVYERYFTISVYTEPLTNGLETRSVTYALVKSVPTSSVGVSIGNVSYRVAEYKLGFLGGSVKLLNQSDITSLNGVRKYNIQYPMIEPINTNIIAGSIEQGGGIDL